MDTFGERFATKGLKRFNFQQIAAANFGLKGYFVTRAIERLEERPAI
jgi:hypothetical protein